MKKKIILITIAMVFILGTGILIAGNMNGGPGKNNWGPIPAPTLNSAVVDTGTVRICWTDNSGGMAEKWSVVLYTTYYYIWDEDCLGCTPGSECVYPCGSGSIPVKLDYNTNDAMDDPDLTFEEVGASKCLEIDEDRVVADIEEYLSLTEDCLDAVEPSITECIDGRTFDPLQVKVKGLAPHTHKGRQNNKFSGSLEVDIDMP